MLAILEPMMLRASFIVSVCCVALVGCGLSRRAAAPAPAGVAPGTYAIEFCRGPCHGQSGDTVLARGHLVIEAAEYPLSELPPVARKYLDDEFSEFMRMSDDSVLDPNACFVLTRVRVDHLQGVGLTRVKPVRGDTVSVDLERSPDSGYFVVLHPAAGELRGWGRGWSYPPVDSPGAVPLDSVRARRIGRPDRALCIRAAEIEAAAWEAQRAPSRP